MATSGKQLSNPFSTGGGGVIFETRVQAAFTILMLAGGFAPCLPQWPIKKIKLQGKRVGYDTDDLIVFVEEPSSKREAKLLAQVKHSIAITKSNKNFLESIKAAWHDFSNVGLFDQETDAISLVTGPLRSTDVEVRTILEWARHSEDARDFLTRVNQTKLSSNTKRVKLTVLRKCLTEANGGKAFSDDQFWAFLRHFHLLEVDLDSESAFVQSVIGSLIGQFAPGDERAVWSMVLDMVQTENQNEGTVSQASIPEELRPKIRRREAASMPAGLAAKETRQPATDWSRKEFAPDLSVAFLMGGWNDSTKGDLEAGAALSKKDVNQWTAAIRRTLQDPDVPLSLRNGTWSSRNRAEVWETLGKSLFDSDLDLFRSVATKVLSEPDPAFDLPANERYMANIKGRVPTHSRALRQGMADTLAVMGGRPKCFLNCSESKAESTALLVVREVLGGADWVLWGSLNDLLPLLAEAAPGEFLSAVEAALERDPCPFKKLFAEEGSGFMGDNYLTGLLWALETLAWDEQYLARVAVILAGLSVMDPGGNWANRPGNSLTAILLPWLPQTTASVEKRLTAMRTVVKEVPDGAWPVLLTLLPNQHQMSSGCHKPRWRQSIPEDREKGVPRKEYWEQVSCYAELALGMAEGNVGRLNKLVEELDSLPPPVFDRLLKHLESPAITGLFEDERTILWSALTEFSARHRRYADADWAVGNDVVDRVDGVASKLAPKNPRNLYKRLFGSTAFDLYEKDGDFEAQERKLGERRQAAICEIRATGGAKAVLSFARDVESPLHVGLALGSIAGEDDDSAVLPAMLDDDGQKIHDFRTGYILSRHEKSGWDWVDRTLAKDWSSGRSGRFLRSLRFCPETWARVRNRLGKDDAEYWKHVFFNPYQAVDHLDAAIDELLDHGRPNAAIDCINALLHKKRPFDRKRAVRALLDAVTTKEPPHSVHIYHSTELIKALQEDPQTDPDDLFNVEWAYLAALDGHRGASPKLLEHRLASVPDFFCEVIRLIFRSKHEGNEKREPTEQEQKVATNAFRLLHRWKTPPGTLADGTFSPSAFQDWMAKVKAMCKKSGHVEVALSHIGQVLIHSPPDPEGLWIHATVADALNAKDADEMRSGLRTGYINSRGVHTVDPRGKPELELAEQYQNRSDKAEKEGYHRLATAMRDLADFYRREADRIVKEHQPDKDKSEATD